MWIGGSLLATAVVAGGVWLVVGEDSPFGGKEQSVSYLAKHAILAKANGELELINVKNGDNLGGGSIQSSTPISYQASHDHETLYAFNGDELFSVKDSGTGLNIQSLIQGLKSEKVEKFATDGATLAFFDEKNESVTIVDLKSKQESTISDVKEVKDLHVQNGMVFYLTSSNLVQVKDGESKEIEVGDTLTSLQPLNGNLVVHSTFGQEKGENIVLYVNPETLDIENLQKTGAVNTSMLKNDDGEEYILVGNYVNTKTPGYLFTRYKAGKNILEKDDLTLRLDIESSETVFTSQNSVVDHDYIYVQSASGLKVYDVKSQAVVSDIPVEIEYAMPVILEKGEGESK